MADIGTWSPVDESNTAAPPAGWPENMQPSAVNNSGRAMMGAVRRWYDTVTAQLAGLTTALGNYLPLTGGTISGNLGVAGTLTAGSVHTTNATLDGVLFVQGGTGIAAGSGAQTNIGKTGTGAPNYTGALQSAGHILRLGDNTGMVLDIGGQGGSGCWLDVTNFSDLSIHYTLQLNPGGGNVTTGGALTANGNIITNGSLTTNLDVTANRNLATAGTCTAAQVTSTGNINAAGTVTGTSFIGNVSVPASGPISTGGTVTGGTVTSTGNMTAAGTVTAAQLTSTGNISVSGDVYASTLRGGNGVDCGVLRTAPTADPARHTLAFGWDSTDPTLYEIIDNSFTAMIPWSETIKSIKIQADAGAPAGWHLAVFTGGLVNYIYSDVVSDARLKRGIADSEADALAALQAVPVRRYEWRDEVQELFGVPQAPVAIGLVAQDLLPTMPDCVGISEGREAPYPADTHVIKHDRMDAYYVRAIQQLAAQNAALTARVTALENAHV